MTVYDIAAKLPESEALRDRCRALAMLSAILNPDNDEYRYHRYDSDWAPGTELASMYNGSGDCYWVAFDPAGVYIQGFDHESELSPYGNDDMVPWPGVVDSVPESLRKYLAEPAFLVEGNVPAATACLWREVTDDQWRTGTIEFPEGADDGAGWLFSFLIDSAEQCHDWAQDYYGRELDLEAVRALLDLRPLTSELVVRLNPEVELAALAKDVEAIGYPRHPEG